MKKIFTIIFTVMLVLTGVSVYAANEPVGIIISMYNGAWVERSGGPRESLTLKTPIYRGDIISTDRTGKAQVLFNDDTSLAVAPMSTVGIDDFIYNSANKPYFSVKVVKGASRVISGKIVEQNPIGFKMSSPHGTAGIRGTVVSVIVGPNDDIYSVDSIDPRHFVDISQNTNILNTTRSAMEGYSIIVNDNPENQNVQRKTTDEERSLMNEVFSSRPAPVDNNNKSDAGDTTETASSEKNKGSDQASGKDAKDKDKKDGDEGEQTASNGDAKKSDDKKSDGKESGTTETVAKKDEGSITGSVESGSMPGDGKTESIVDNKNHPGVGDATIKDTVKDNVDTKDQTPELPKTFNAFYSGNLNATKNAPAGFKGDFGFKVDLNTGRYTDGYMHGQAKGSGVFNASGGTGIVNRNGGFSSGGYDVSGTGDYKNANGGAMKGNVTGDSALIEDWFISGGGSILIGGNGLGKVTDSITNKPYDDPKASFAGNWTSNSGESHADRRFGFNLRLISGDIADAFLSYADGGGAMKAEGGSGRAKLGAVDKFFATFDIGDFKVTGYAGQWHNNGGTANLSGNITNNETGVTILGGSMGDHVITGGTGAKVDSLPGITTDRTVTFTSFWSNDISNDTTSPNVGEHYYKYGFRVNLLTADITDLYMYGGNFGETVNGEVSDNNAFWAQGGSGKVGDKRQVTIQVKNAQMGDRYTSQGFNLIGEFSESYGGFSGEIRYVGNTVINWEKKNAILNGPWEPIPFMVGYYEGSADAGTKKSGFKVNLASGNISKAYLAIKSGADTLTATEGTGVLLFDNGKVTVDVAWDKDIVGSGSYNKVSSGFIRGTMSTDYASIPGARIGFFEAAGGVFDKSFIMDFKKTENPTPFKAYYSSTLSPVTGAGALAHTGGKIGFGVNLLDGKVSDAGFYVKRASGNALYAWNGEGQLNKNIMKVDWVGKNISSSGSTSYGFAQLTGDIDKMSKLLIGGAGDGSDPRIIDNTIAFKTPDNLGEKKGTVSGQLSGNGVTSGSYSFQANLYSGVITGGSMNVNMGNSNLDVSNGTGYIDNGKFNIDNYNKKSASGAFGNYGNANMNGSNNESNFDNIKWNVNNANGGSIANGQGTPGTIRP